MKVWAFTLGLGAVIGAVSIMMMPQNNPTRKLATQAAQKVEDAALKIGNKLNSTTLNN